MIDPLCEQCEDSDPTNMSVDNGCTAEDPNCANCTTCSQDVCADGIIGPNEDCDEGGICSDNEMDCTTLDLSNCTQPDAVCNTYVYLYPDESKCLRDCTLSVCGDGVLSSFEACENTDPTNAEIDLGCSETFPNCDPNCGYCTSADI